MTEVEALTTKIETMNLSLLCYIIGAGIFLGFISAVFVSWRIGTFAERINSRFVAWFLTFLTMCAVYLLIVYVVALVISAGQSILQ